MMERKVEPRMTRMIRIRKESARFGALMAGLNELKPGLDEKLYERALVLELDARGHRVDAQRRFEVFYRGQLIGCLVPDLIVDDLVIVDCKVSTAFTETHVTQMIGYLNITHLRLALLINFKFAQLQWKRVVIDPPCVSTPT
jgi:GxxExxY protein